MPDIFDGLTLKQISLMTQDDVKTVTEDIIVNLIKNEMSLYIKNNSEYINSQPQLISCLYDIGLLPEQILAEINHEIIRYVIIGHKNLKRLMFIVDLWKNQKET